MLSDTSRRGVWSWSCCVALVVGLVVLGTGEALKSTTLEPVLFDDKFDILYNSESHIERTYDGQAVSLSMTEKTGSGFQSKEPFLFGQLSLKIKLVEGDSAGVVVCFYMHSMTENHDEFDFEFLGNKSGEPVILQTNIYANGEGGREERISLWFDPSKMFHTYTVLWNREMIVFYVDTFPIRYLKKTPSTKSFYPDKKPMWVFASIWNGDDWATRGGQDKVNWTHSPFVTHLKDFKLDGCVYDKESGPDRKCISPSYTGEWWSTHTKLNAVEQKKLEWVRAKYIDYDYCQDRQRYGAAILETHPECAQEY